MEISWNDFKARNVNKFNIFIDRLAQEHNMSRNEVIDLIDAGYTFEYLKEGLIRITEDKTGRYSLVCL
jgi:hypothetical protein